MVRKATITNHQADYAEIENKALLDSTRLGELLCAHDTVLAEAEQVLRLRESYAENLRAAKTRPRAVESIEDYEASQRHSSELLCSASAKTRQADNRLQALRKEAQGYLEAMLHEGMPEGMWVGAGDGEYILIERESAGCEGAGCEEHDSPQPMLYRVPAKALALAPAWAPAAAVEDKADELIRTAYGSVVESGCRVLSVVGAVCAVLGLALIVTSGSLGLAPAFGGVAVFGGLMCMLAARTARDLAPPSPEEVVAKHPPEKSNDEPSDHLTQTDRTGARSQKVADQ